MKPFRFLVDLREVASARELGERARRAEAIGFHAVVIPDHLIDQLSPIPAMAVVAAATERIRVSAFVLNNDLRHPAVLAQDLASLDVLSEGRLDVAIGAGWNVAEYDAVGIAFAPGPTRVTRLEEAVRVLKGCFADDPLTFDGEHYRITEYDARPKPVQRPQPPFMIGGGQRRILSFAAREAQIVGLAPTVGPPDPTRAKRFTRASVEQQVGWVRAAAGDRIDEVTLNIYPSSFPVTVTDDARGDARRAAAALSQRGVELTEDEVLASPYLYIGSLDGLAEKFIGLREELGISSFMVGEPGPLDALVERLAGT